MTLHLENCIIRTFFRHNHGETRGGNIPEIVRNAIKPVTKYSRIYSSSTGSAVDNVATTETVWIPNTREMGWTWYESNSPTYSLAFSNNASRVKKNVSTGSAAWWWLRSAFSYITAYGVSTDGSDYTNGVNYTSGGVVVGFCL